jgi:methylenetetrahydrofolate dehydrogenase (NADP+)/methenyltetrahydrofolate cyclohydrolase
MSATIFDGKAIADRVYKKGRSRRRRIGHHAWAGPVLVGNDPASAIYVRNKRKRGVEAGMRDTHRYPCAMLSGLGAMLSGFGVVLAGDVAQSVQDAQFGIDGGGDAGDAAGELLGRQWLFGVTKDGRPRAAKGGPR